jgi:pSer/pThr/pTyr-binding forkhead associated (FHA) protein
MVDANQELPLPTDKSQIIIGREDPVSHIFPEIDLTPFGGETGGVSRQHARITHENGQWKITDLNSTNFTHLDNTRLEPNVATPLHDGAKVRFGRIATVFKIGS